MKTEEILKMFAERIRDDIPPNTNYEFKEEYKSHNEYEKERLQEELRKLECPWDDKVIKHWHLSPQNT